MKRLTTDEFIHRAYKLHGDLYDYSQVEYVSMHINVKIICRKHGVFYQSPSNHLKGYGCPICNKSEKRRLAKDEVIHRFKEMHGDTYDYSLMDYQGTKRKVKIICPEHGIFEQTPEKHMVGQGCPKCIPNAIDTKETFIEKSRNVHGDLYDYSKVEYINSQTKVCIIDPEFGEFWQMPYAHISGKGHWLRRPEKCYITKKENHSFNSSKPEKIVYALLCDKFGVENILTQYKSESYPFACDFYVKSYDLYIELNLHVTHCGHWFDETNEDDRQYLYLLKQKASDRNMYKNMIRVWTNTDLKKRDCALQQNLNYVVFWKDDLSDFMDWYDTFDNNPILKLI